MTAQLADAKDRKARKAAQTAVSQAKGRVSKYEDRLQELAATPGVPKVEVGSLEEVRGPAMTPRQDWSLPSRHALRDMV